MSVLLNPHIFYSPLSELPPGIALWIAPWQEVGYSDGDAMATVKDFSGNGRDFTQATSGSRPLFKTNILNGQPSVKFDGTDDFIERTAFMAASAAEMFCVLRIPTGIGSSNWGWMKFSGAGLADHFTFFGTAYSTFGGTNRTNYTPSSTDFEAGMTAHILAKAGASAWKCYEDGNVEKATMTQTMDWGTNRHLIGASSGNSDASSVSNYFNGHILELQIYANELSASERNQVYDGLQDRFGITYTAF